jgi:transposase
MVLDQAAGMTDVRSACLPTGRSWPLPPYSPKLNPVERMRLYLRERFLSPKLQNDEATTDEPCRACRCLTTEAGRIKSLYTYPWIPKLKTKP